jgi:hypothetical protein
MNGTGCRGTALHGFHQPTKVAIPGKQYDLIDVLGELHCSIALGA